MANLNKNPLWSNLDNQNIMGPSFDYAGAVPGPSSLGVGSDGSFSQLSTNASAVGTYIKTLISGDPPLGDSYFVNTGGMCTAPNGSLQVRSNYINNKPQTQDDMPAGLKDLGSDFNGLIPGTVGDITALNPLYLFKSLAADAEPACKCYKCDVTSGAATAYLTSELSPDFDPSLCQEVDPSQCTSTESFTNSSSFDTGVIPTLLAISALIYIIVHH